MLKLVTNSGISGRITVVSKIVFPCLTNTSLTLESHCLGIKKVFVLIAFLIRLSLYQSFPKDTKLTTFFWITLGLKKEKSKTNNLVCLFISGEYSINWMQTPSNYKKVSGYILFCLRQFVTSCSSYIIFKELFEKGWHNTLLSNFQ